MADALLITCEHGGNDVPVGYRQRFAGAEAVLESHRGWDPGALDLAERLAGRLRAPIVAASVTRLLVDLNRSVHNPAVFSEYTRGLDRRERARLLHEHHGPHRHRVRRAVAHRLEGADRLIHVGVHTFTPVLHGDRRTTDLALLYDPARPGERSLAAAWTSALRKARPELTVHRNRPYRGTSDGLTTWLRGLFPTARYLGIELEVNQRLLVDGCFETELVDALEAVLRSGGS